MQKHVKTRVRLPASPPNERENMKQRNYHFYGTQEEVTRLAEEYRFLGRNVVVEPGHLTVLALPIKKTKKKIDPREQNRKPKADVSEEDSKSRSDDRGRQERRGVVSPKSQRPKG